MPRHPVSPPSIGKVSDAPAGAARKPTSAEARAVRTERLAAALRANLRRRKAARPGEAGR